MGVKIAVTDRRDEPVKGASVRVQWTDGSSNGQTNEQGVYDTGTSGTIVEVKVNGKVVFSGRIKYGPSITMSVQLP